MSEVIFEVREDTVDGGFTASALGVGIHTQADSIVELRANVREAVDCYFDEESDAPKIIRLHLVRDEVLAPISVPAAMKLPRDVSADMLSRH